MTPLALPHGSGEWVAWRLDRHIFKATWDSGEGAFLFGGRWNSKGVRAVYCSLDPSTAILEVAAHKGFEQLDAVAHILTALDISIAAAIHVVEPDDVPNPDWLRPFTPVSNQQKFGDALLARHSFIAIPSAVSAHSWNLIFDRDRAAGAYRLRLQERFALDMRLNPPAAP